MPPSLVPTPLGDDASCCAPLACADPSASALAAASAASCAPPRRSPLAAPSALPSPTFLRSSVLSDSASASASCTMLSCCSAAEPPRRCASSGHAAACPAPLPLPELSCSAAFDCDVLQSKMHPVLHPDKRVRPRGGLKMTQPRPQGRCCLQWRSRRTSCRCRCAMSNACICAARAAASMCARGECKRGAPC